MDYQCIVVYTIVRICPFYPYTAEFLQKQRRQGCFFWIKSYIKRYAYAFSLNTTKWIWILLRILLLSAPYTHTHTNVAKSVPVMLSSVGFFWGHKLWVADKSWRKILSQSLTRNCWRKISVSSYQLSTI